jgi:XTP/dITP diphosphohydrolase
MGVASELTGYPSSRAVLVATRSMGKMRELGPLLADAGLQVVTLRDLALEETDSEESLESFETFEENALAKARWFSARSGGRVVLADDSGLSVDALDGRPGVLSKRWAGSVAEEGPLLDAANSAYLLQQLAEADRAGRSDRSARFVCAAACVWSGGGLVAVGTTEGRILHASAGEGGFGYDPLFHSNDLHVTFGQATRELKATASHRARAFALLIARMQTEKSLASKLFGPVDPEGGPG